MDVAPTVANARRARGAAGFDMRGFPGAPLLDRAAGGQATVGHLES